MYKFQRTQKCNEFSQAYYCPPPHGFWVSGENGYLFSGSWKVLVIISRGAQWLSGRVLDSRPKGRRFEPHRRRCVVSLSKNINPSLELVQPRKTCPFITERLLMGLKESNQTNKKLFSGTHSFGDLGSPVKNEEI